MPAPDAWRKLAASGVIVAVLGMQIRAASAHDPRARWYPFVDYPMYAPSYAPPATASTFALLGRGCDAGAPPVLIRPQTIGEQGIQLRVELGVIARGRPAAARHRTRLSAAVSRFVRPRPCALEVRERRVSMTRTGVDVTALRTPRWTVRAVWPVDPSDSGRVGAPQRTDPLAMPP